MCSLRYTACKAHAPYSNVVCGLSDLTIFFHIISLIIWFSENVIQHKIWVLIFSATFACSISRFKKNSIRYYHKFTNSLTESAGYSCRTWWKVPVILVTLDGKCRLFLSHLTESAGYSCRTWWKVPVILVALDGKCRLFLSHLTETGNFSTVFQKLLKYSNIKFSENPFSGSQWVQPFLKTKHPQFNQRPIRFSLTQNLTPVFTRQLLSLLGDKRILVTSSYAFISDLFQYYYPVKNSLTLSAPLLIF